MKVPEAKTIDTLYNEVKDYDTVLTVDAPLADALNNRVDTPIIGTFATTPRQLILHQYENTALMQRQDLFLHLINNTSLTPKTATTALDVVISAWKHTGNHDGILEYERYNTENIKAVVDAIRHTETIYGKQETTTLNNDTDIAVIGLKQFTELDKTILPKKFDTIHPFHKKDTELPQFSVFNSTTGILQAVEKTIANNPADDIALVVDPASMYQSAIESLLDAHNIPYLLPDRYKENRDLRLVLSLLDTVWKRKEIVLHEIQPLLRSLDIIVPDKHNNKRIYDINNTEIDAFRTLLETLSEKTFDQALKHINQQFNIDTNKIRDIIDRLDLLSRPVSEENTDTVKYYIDTFQPTGETQNRGVLLASPESTAYIDKPIVLYIGMDSSWTQNVDERPWIDRTVEENRHIQQFKLLLQNGIQQHFLVQDQHQNRPVSPCSYFSELADGHCETFTDKDAQRYNTSTKEPEGFEYNPLDVDQRTKQYWSKSSLNSFAWSPRLYFFDNLVTDIDTFYTTRGTLFHDFAEFYISHPDIVDNNGTDAFLDIIMEEIKPYREEKNLDYLRSRFRIGLQTLIAFIDDCDIKKSTTDDFNQDPDNAFATYFDTEITATITELEFQNPDIGAKGIVDFLTAPTEIIDFKTGQRKSSSHIVKQSNPTLRDKTTQPSFQAILYLTHQRQLEPETELQFTFLHIFGDADKKLNDDTPVDDFTTTQITYIPQDFHDHLHKQTTYEELKERTNALEKLLTPLGYTGYTDLIDAIELETTVYDKEKLKNSCLNALREKCRSLLDVGRGKDITERQLDKGTDRLLTHIHRLRTRNYFKEDLDRFEQYLKDKLAEFNQDCVPGTFPVGTVDRTHRKFNHKDLVREPEAKQ